MPRPTLTQILKKERFHMNNNLSPEKKALLELTDEQVRAILKLVERATKPKNRGEKFVPPAEAIEHLREIEGLDARQVSQEDQKWVRYLKKFQTLSVAKPMTFEVDDRSLYRRMKAECEAKNLSPFFAEQIVPSMVSFFTTGEMKPVIFEGPPGCGKTTEAMAMAVAMGRPLARISAPQAELGHGFGGEARSYRDADIGSFGSHILRNEEFFSVFFVDEPDKSAADTYNRASQQDTLLNVLEDRAIQDNFMGFSIPILGPLIFAVNDIDKLSRPFRDRCDIVHFEAPSLERLLRIVKEYSEECLTTYKGKILLDQRYVETACEVLFDAGVASIRQHRQLVEKSLRGVYTRYLESDEAVVAAKEKDFLSTAEALSGKQRIRKIGFAI